MPQTVQAKSKVFVTFPDGTPYMVVDQIVSDLVHRPRELGAGATLEDHYRYEPNAANTWWTPGKLVKL